jgi:hypothetical protein
MKYREVILFNKNIIIAAAASIAADATVVHYAAKFISSNIVVSIFSIMTDTGVYLAVFAGMFLIDNRKRYVDHSTGRKDSVKFRNDIKKIITALGVSELVYMVVKFISVYLLLQTSIAPPYQIAMLSTLLAWIFYLIAVNAMIRWQRLFG